MNYRVSRFKRIRNQMNKAARRYNKNLWEDQLFPHRFYIHECGYNYEPYEDGSGCSMSVVYEAIDLKCRNSGKFVLDQYGFKWRLFDYMNDFVIRCRDGIPGHIPQLHWLALDINTIEA